MDEKVEWLANLETALKAVHSNYGQTSEMILTESDLKCWLFLELQKIKNKTYAVHSEVTHFVQTTLRENQATVKMRKYFLRDLTLLNNNNIDENEVLWENVDKKQLLNKGFKHTGHAIHIELKLIRQTIAQNRSPRIDLSDLDNLENYSPNSENKRRFVIVIGSKSHHITPDEIATKLKDKIQNFKNKSSLNNILDFYFFDKDEIVKYSWINGDLEIENLRP
jgi:hypothetical protein